MRAPAAPFAKKAAVAPKPVALPKPGAKPKKTSPIAEMIERHLRGGAMQHMAHRSK